MATEPRGNARYPEGVSMSSYEHLGNGPAATGSSSGWRMRAGLIARCLVCDYYMILDPDTYDTCACGAMNKDPGAGRFGSRLGDDRIEIYRHRP